MSTWRDSARVVIGVAKRSRRAVVDMNKKRIEIHICPILMRTVRFIDGQCEQSNCLEKEDCPIMIEIERLKKKVAVIWWVMCRKRRKIKGLRAFGLVQI